MASVQSLTKLTVNRIDWVTYWLYAVNLNLSDLPCKVRSVRLIFTVVCPSYVTKSVNGA